MAEEIKELIEKIQQEGVQQAELKAQEIEAGARKEAQEIIQEAKAEAKKILEDAAAETKRLKEGTEVSLRQASRDMVLALKEEIIALLGKIIQYQARQALSPEELSRIITSFIKAYPNQEDVLVTLSKDDAEKLDGVFLQKLKEETQRGIILKPSEEISGGFRISFDAGKSSFDFTDESLAEYIGSALKPELARFIHSRPENRTLQGADE